MFLYAEQASPRLLYVIDFLNKEMFQDDLAFTNDIQQYQSAALPKLNYSDRKIADDEFHIVPSGLLFETDIRNQEVTCFGWDTMIAFFPVTYASIPFDILSAIFYLISRYEEYLPHELDAYGRYAHTNSLAYKEGFLDQPLVNNWILKWEKILRELYPNILLRHRTFKFIPTYDIDIMYAYKGKSWWVNAAGFCRSLLKGDSDAAFQRLRVLQNEEKDPYDAYEWLDALHLYCRSQPVYFFLVAQQQHGYDKNLPTETPGFRDLIKYSAEAYKVGIHPSWQSSVAPDTRLLKEELEWLEAVADVPVSRSRHHYIKFMLPQHYERLLAHNIMHDYSMGYGSINGFRASTCSTFNWFNLAKNEATELLIYPFCFMDANAYFEQKLTPAQAYAELKQYYYAVQKVQGCLITIWHNNILGTAAEFEGWRDLYEIFMKEDIFWDAG
ncbi:MAG: hypothetical protein LCH51_12400 [Bacteroidetes bacterium]|nr:hypothetical protein [Bacteroidota bacterium]